MNFLRTDRIKSILWLLVVSSWVFGVIVGRWFGSESLFLELSKAVRVPSPEDISLWWEFIVYFSLSIVSVFILSRILFGVGGAVFLFARGIYDNSLIVYLEGTIAGWSITQIPISEVLMSLIVVLILAINLPLCLWSGQVGIQRSIYTLERLRGEPIDPEFGSEPFSNLVKFVTVSLLVGLLAALLYSYA